MSIRHMAIGDRAVRDVAIRRHDVTVAVPAAADFHQPRVSGLPIALGKFLW